MPHIDGVNVPEQFVRVRSNAPTLAATKAITDATNADPIVITSNAHGYSNGDVILVAGVEGNTAANGWRLVANKTVNTYELTTLAGVNVAGNGAYTVNGTSAKMSSTVGVVSSRDIWLVKTRLNNTTGGAITFNLTDNLSGATSTTGPNYRYQAFSVAANTAPSPNPPEGYRPPEKCEEGAVFYASATGLEVTIEGWRKPNLS